MRFALEKGFIPLGQKIEKRSKCGDLSGIERVCGRIGFDWQFIEDGNGAAFTLTRFASRIRHRCNRSLAGFPRRGYAGSLGLLLFAICSLDGFIEQELSLLGLNEHVVSGSAWLLQPDAQRQIFGPNFPDFGLLHCLCLPLADSDCWLELASVESRALPQRPLGLPAILET